MPDSPPKPEANGLMTDSLHRKATAKIYGSVEPNVVRVEKCASWDEFKAKVCRTSQPMAGRVFRGQSDAAWKLQSKWDRYLDRRATVPTHRRAVAGLNDTPDSLLERFQACYVGTAGFDTSTMTQEQWFALGRHHGLITPLLDWTHSPFVAAFFSFLELAPIDPELGCLNPLDQPQFDGDVAVWELPLESVCNKFEHFRFVHARHDFVPRQRAQSGLFTLVDSPDHNSLEDYLASKGYAHCLIRYEIPKNEVVTAVHDLDLMNINEGTMFPDADGAARQANLGPSLSWAAFLEDLRQSNST